MAVEGQQVVPLRGEEQVERVGPVVGEEEHPLPPHHGLAGEEERQAGDRHRDHHRDVEGERRLRYRDALPREDAGQSQHGGDVEDVAAHRVADRDVPLPVPGRDHRGRDLGQGGPERDHGEADHELAQAQRAREDGGAFHQPSGPERQEQEAERDEAGVREERPVPPRGRARRHRRLPAARSHREDGVADPRRHQQQAVGRAQPAVQGQQVDRGREADQDGHVEPHQAPRDDERRRERGQSDHSQDVEDVAAHHVPDGDVSLASQRRPQAHRELRGARAPGHHGEADDEGRDAEARGHRGGSVDEGVAPDHEEDEAGEEESDGEQHPAGAYTASGADGIANRGGSRAAPFPR